MTEPEGPAVSPPDFGGPRSKVVTWHDPMVLAASAAGLTGLQFLEALRDGLLPPPPIATLVGMNPVSVVAGDVVFKCLPDESVYNPIGVVHGGYAATLLDSVLGCAVHTTLPAGVGYTSLGLELKFVRPITRDTGRVLCEAKVLYRGRKQATAEARLTAAESGKLLAHGQSTLMIIGGDAG